MQDLQKDLALLAEHTTELKRIDASLVAMCESEQAAMRLCRRLSHTHFTDEALASRLGISKGHLNQLLNSDQNKRERHMSRRLANNLQRVCGNRAVNQWSDMELDGLLDHQRSIQDREAELEAQLAAIREQKLRG